MDNLHVWLVVQLTRRDPFAKHFSVKFGNIFLDKSWRILSALEAANGFIFFGSNTAFIFDVMNRAYSENEV